MAIDTTTTEGIFDLLAKANSPHLTADQRDEVVNDAVSAYVNRPVARCATCSKLAKFCACK